MSDNLIKSKHTISISKQSNKQSKS